MGLERRKPRTQLSARPYKIYLRFHGFKIKMCQICSCIFTAKNISKGTYCSINSIMILLHTAINIFYISYSWQTLHPVLTTKDSKLCEYFLCHKPTCEIGERSLDIGLRVKPPLPPVEPKLPPFEPTLPTGEQKEFSWIRDKTCLSLRGDPSAKSSKKGNDFLLLFI